MERLVKTKLMPAYYKDFHCVGGACRDDCCSDGWRITFDKKDYLKLHREDVPPELRERLDKIIHRLRGKLRNNTAGHYAEFDLKGGGCPLQNEDGLCSLQLACGEDALPEVCRVFPRAERYTAAGKELVLSPACEAVLRLLWELPDGVDFVEEDLPEKEWRMMIPGEGSLTFWFPEIRSLCIDILQARLLPLGDRMLLLGIALRELTELDWTAPDVDGWLARTAARLADPGTQELLAALPGNRMMFLTQNIRLLLRLNQITESLCKKSPLPELAGKTEFTLPLEEYQRRLDAFNAAFGDIEYFFENLMVTALFYLGSPSLKSPENLWKEYVSLCNLYSAYRFAAVMGCAEEPTKEQLFHILVELSRRLLHSTSWRNSLQDEFFENDSATLAHMAILVGE